jgi:hypothetical protein
MGAVEDYALFRIKFYFSYFLAKIVLQKINFTNICGNVSVVDWLGQRYFW